MLDVYGRDLDLNLLRVFVAVADSGSVTKAAARLYLTQPAVSASLRRLRTAIGASVFVRQGRGLALTARGERLASEVRPHLQALVAASLSPPRFDPKTSDRVVRLGLSDSNEPWLVPRLLRWTSSRAPHMRFVCVPVQFRTVEEAFSSRRIDLAVTIADELPPSIRRVSLKKKEFVCLFDPRHVKVGVKISEREYFARDHVIVSYNADLRGLVEDLLGKTRRVRVSVSSFSNIGAIVEGTALLATVPEQVAFQLRRAHPRLRVAKLPFALESQGMELLWSDATDTDEACAFIRDAIVRITSDGSPASRVSFRRST